MTLGQFNQGRRRWVGDARSGRGRGTETARTNGLTRTLCDFPCARLGRDLHFDPGQEKFIYDAEADKLLGRQYRENH